MAKLSNRDRLRPSFTPPVAQQFANTRDSLGVESEPRSLIQSDSHTKRHEMSPQACNLLHRFRFLAMSLHEANG